jgi:ribosome-binding factor A
MASRRILRLNELIREELAELLRRDARDPRLSGLITITEVDTSPDLANCRVYISVLGSEEETTASLRALQHAAGYLRRELMPKLRIRRMPMLEFRLDSSLARGARVLELLREVRPD